MSEKSSRPYHLTDVRIIGLNGQQLAQRFTACDEHGVPRYSWTVSSGIPAMPDMADGWSIRAELQ